MAHAALSRLDDWHLVHAEQDIRGWKVVDASGATIGRVDELMVSTDTEMVEVVRLDNGNEFSAGDIEIGDHVVYLRGQRPGIEEANEPIVKVYNDARIRRRGETREEDAPGYAEYEDDFRSHYTAAYASTGEDYTYYEPAYRYGYTSAFATPYKGREWAAAESDLQRGYADRTGRSTWDRVKDAVRHGWNRGRGHGRT